MSNSSTAPCYEVPDKSILGVEHPFIIRNLEKGILSLGGKATVKKVARPPNSSNASSNFDRYQILDSNKPDETIRLYLVPGDRERKPVISGNVRTNNVVLRIEVPKRTGRKRKRGSDQPFQFPPDDRATEKPVHVNEATRRYLRSMRDNPNRYLVQPVGVIYQTHRFRSIISNTVFMSHFLMSLDMPDFVYSTANSPFMQKFREHILPFECELSL